MGRVSKLSSEFVVIKDDLQADAVRVTPELYANLDRDYGNFAGHLLVASHAFDNDWPTWEIHPAGDEIVILVSGDADLVLAGADGDEVITMNEPGTYAIVPRNTWHTAHVRSHTVMTFITPGEGTENREEPDRGE